MEREPYADEIAMRNAAHAHLEERPSYLCSCIVNDHDHEHRQCTRRATIAGGICTECRYWAAFPERKDNLG